MRKFSVVAILATSIVLPALSGCGDRELSHSEKVRTNSNGTEVRESKTVKQTPNGDVVTEKQKSVNPDNHP